MQMDIDQIMYQAVSKDNSTEELKGFIQSQGARQSANEHLVPEQLFDDTKTAEKEVEGVSAVKAIQIAQQQGQTVYTITRDNYAQVLPKLRLSSTVMTDIRDAVNAGLTVTTHEKIIQYKGWHGSGYIIIDPNTGAGAYLIDGGANGGLAFAVGAALGSLLALIVLPMAPVSVGVAVLFTPYILFAIAAITVLLYLFWDTIKDNEFARSCFMLGLGFGFGIRLGLGQLSLTMRSLIQFVAGTGVAFGTGWFTGVDKCLK